MKKKSTEHLENKNQIATACGCDPATAKKWTADPAFPRRTKSGWPTVAVLEYGARAMSAHAKQITGENADLKRLKIAKQVEKLNQDIRRATVEADNAILESAKAKKEVILISEHNEQLLKLAGVVKRTLEHLPKDIAAICSDSSVFKALETTVFNLLTMLSTECERENI
jgi:hypothetical protein